MIDAEWLEIVVDDLYQLQRHAAQTCSRRC